MKIVKHWHGAKVRSSASGQTCLPASGAQTGSDGPFLDSIQAKSLIKGLFVALICLAALLCAPEMQAEGPGGKPVKIKLLIGNEVLEGVPEYNSTARDFASLLPMTIKLEDYAGKEKVHTFSRKLSLEGAPSGSKGMTGDITYYAPWGNMAIFYRDHGYASGLVPLGRLKDVHRLAELCKSSCTVTIEKVQD